MASQGLLSKASKVTFKIKDRESTTYLKDPYSLVIKPVGKSMSSTKKISKRSSGNIPMSPSLIKSISSYKASVIEVPPEEKVPSPVISTNTEDKKFDKEVKKSKKKSAKSTDKKRKKKVSIVVPANENPYSSEALVKKFSKASTESADQLKKKSKKSKTKQSVEGEDSEREEEVRLAISTASYELVPVQEEDEPKAAEKDDGASDEKKDDTTKLKQKGKSKKDSEKSEKGQSEAPEKKDKDKAEDKSKAKRKGKAKAGKGVKRETSKHVRLTGEASVEIDAAEQSRGLSKSQLTVKSQQLSASLLKEKSNIIIKSSKISGVGSVISGISGASKTSRASRGSRFPYEPGDDSSGSSSVEEQGSRHRRSLKSSRTSKTSKKKSTLKSDSLIHEGDDEEVLQNIIQPASTSQVIVPEEDKISKKAKPKKESKPKAKKPSADKKGKKDKKPAKTEAELEEEAKAKAEEERRMALEAKREAISQEKRELLEASMRGEQLDQITSLMQEVDDALNEVLQEEQAAEEWRQYLVCDGLPAPWDIPGMNTYLHLWEKEVYTVTADRCRERTKEAIQLLERLDEIRDDPFDKAPSKQSDWAWVSSRFREFQALNLEYCTYRLLRDIKSKMNRIDIPTSDFRMQEELFSLCLWVSITLPTPTPNPRHVTKTRISLQWPEISIDAIIFPQALKREMVAIRGIYTKYDHLTDTCDSFKVHSIPEFYKKSLKDACFGEIYCKMKYKYENRVVIPKAPVEIVQEDGTVVIEEPEPEPELPPDEIPPTVPYQKLEVSPSDHCSTAIADEISDALRQFAFDDLPALVVNLRKYTVIGGLYYMDYFYQPPQPQGMVSYEVFISSLTAPYSLQTAPFHAQYVPPPPIQPGTRRTPEEIEEELQQQEKELDELIFVQIKLPTHVYWLENPMIVQWDYDYNAWTTDKIFDFKNIEEKGYVTFRTGIFRPIGIATLRWSNMPYQAWEIRPEKDGTVTFQLSCAILTLEFHVVQNTICVRDIQSAPNDAFDQHLNVYYHFSRLRTIMKSTGIDVFPFFDTFLYVDGTCEKYWPMENHLYFCMAYMSMAFNMTWSRWNNTLDYRSAVFQMRIYRFDRPKQANFDTVLARAQHTVYIDCTEVSQEFSDTPAENMRFFADLWHLVRSTTTKSLRARITAADKTMVQTLYRLYKNVRFLSLS